MSGEGAVVANPREMHGVAGGEPKRRGEPGRHFLRPVTKKIAPPKHCRVCLRAGQACKLLQLLHVVLVWIGWGWGGVPSHGPTTPWTSKSRMCSSRVVPRGPPEVCPCCLGKLLLVEILGLSVNHPVLYLRPLYS